MRETAEQYQHLAYQRTQEIQARLSYGMTLEERYEIEARFALESAEFPLPFSPGSRILDMASGIGGHANIMRNVTGADVDARDLSNALIEEGRRQEDVRAVRGEIKGRIFLEVGDMANISASLPDGVHYKLITCLGDSFLYLPTPEANQEALNQYSQVLEPGGKIVFQFRTGVRPQSKGQREEWGKKRAEWAQKLQVSESTLHAQETEMSPGKCVPKGSSIYWSQHAS